MLISEEYRELNRQLHEENTKYGAGIKWVETINTLSDGTILDYGCGKGNLAKLLPDLPISEYDPAIEGKDSLPEPADLVVCNDVLEHVEPEYLDNVIKHLISLTKKQLLLVIACRPGDKYLPDGRLAHLTVEDEGWWMKKLSQYGDFKKIPPKSKRELAVILTK